MQTKLKVKAENILFLMKACLKKPRVFVKMVSEFFRNRFMGQKRLRFMDIAVDYRCNMTCLHCSASKFLNHDREQLSHKDFAKIAEDLYREGCVIFHFTGGEPLLRSDLEKIIKQFKPNRSIISIQSNGLLISPERLKSLKQAGVDIINISIDSGDSIENDRFRNMKGAYNKAIEAVKLIKKFGFSCSVSTCISHDNIRSEGLKRLIEITRELNVWCYFNLAVPIGRWQSCSDFMLTAEDQILWRRLEEKYDHCRIDLKSNWFQVGCGAIKEKGYLTAYGDFMTCPFIHVSFGNLLEKPISKIRADAMKLPEFKGYWPRCLAAEEIGFINKVPCYNDWVGETPIPFNKVSWMKEVIEG